MSLALASRLNAVLRNGRHPEDSRSLERVEGSCADNGAPSQASAFLVGKKLSLIIIAVAIVALAGGCNQPDSTPVSTNRPSKSTTASDGASPTSNEIGQAMIGKQITVHGKVGFSKIGWYVLLDNQQEIYFFPGRSSDWESSAEMRGKLVTATGVLRFSQCPKNPLTDKEGRVINKEGRIIDRCSDYYYFDDQPSQVRPAPGA
jgi:hypothetical protein